MPHSMLRRRIARAALIMMMCAPLAAQDQTAQKGRPREEIRREIMEAIAAAPKSEPHMGPTAGVTREAGKWVIKGAKNTATLDEKTLELTVKTPAQTWAMAAADANDMIVRKGEGLTSHSLLSAGSIDFRNYDTGFLQGVKIRFENFPEHPGLAVVLTVGLEGEDEELVCSAAAVEGTSRVNLLNWPKAMRAEDVDYTVLSNFKGLLLPRNLPVEYYPMEGDAEHHGLIESNLIECWSMSWWGFQRGKAAMMIIVETSADAAYNFSHPAGGPTVIGPKWRDSLGKLAYPRQLRMCFFDEGNYVTLAKRYRGHVMDAGRFVSLKEKIAKEPKVAKLIGAPQTRQHALTHYNEKGVRFERELQNAYRVRTFKELSDQLRSYKEAGIENLIGVLCGWPRLGYDREHPHVLPPAPEAGGWEGMKEWVETCKELGYAAVLHDQYRDYYTDSPVFSLEFSVQEEVADGVSTMFPGTRFNDWKEGRYPYMDNWDGGPMTVLNARFQPGHLIKNYRELFKHGIRPEGSYLDVYGYVPPTQDFSPDHPTTRQDNMNGRAACFTWARQNLGIVGTESGADWTVQYVDFISGNNDPGGARVREAGAIHVPLYQLVYHDAVITHGGDYLSTIEGGGIVSLGLGRRGGSGINPEAVQRVKRASALHKRIALVELTNHEVLADGKQRSTFADGTTVTIDRANNSWEANPPVQ